VQTGLCPRSSIRHQAFALLIAAGLSASISNAQIAVDPAAPPDPHAIHLRAAVVPTVQANPDLASSIPGAADRRFVIQLDGPMTPERARSLSDAGILVLDYLPINAYIARLDGAQPAAVAALDFVRWHAPFDNTWKIDPELGNRVPMTPERQVIAAQGLTHAMVTLFADATIPDIEIAANAILALPGGKVLGRDTIGANTVVFVHIRPADAPLLAALNAVQFIEEAPEITLRNSTNRWIVQSNIAGNFPLYDRDIKGQGQIVGVLDSSLDKDHCSFLDSSNPIGPLHRKIVAYNAADGNSSHGTHVSGTVAGDGGADNDTRGVAYLAKIAYGPIPSFTESAVNTALTLHHSQGARLHTNSWGNDGTTAYDGLCRGIDLFSFNNEDDLVLFAVTNLSSLKNPENAKNLLAVGASQDTPNQGSHCSGGAGPTSDGRRKPEIYAPGCSTLSSQVNTACSVTALTGTSMACPAVTGTGALIRQYFMEGWYPTGIENPSDAFTPSGALIKATLLNSAVDMTGPAGYPSNQEGWGRVLAGDSLFFLGDTRKLFVEDVRNADGLTTGAIQEHNLNIVGSTERLKVTLVWAEPPAASGASIAYINDLDLEVVAPDNTTYKGNVFSGGVSVPGGSADFRNNVEQVHINNPSPGPWTLRVKATAVNQGAILGNPTQGFALVATGDFTVEPPGLVIFASGAPDIMSPGAPVSFNVTILPGSDTVVPGTQKLHYRYNGGAYIEKPLVPLGGDLWRADLPAPDCQDTPEFYVSVQGVNGGTKTAPPGAPTTVYDSMVGGFETQVIYTQNFESGLPPGWTQSGLWHITTACPVVPVCDGTRWGYFGQDSTCDYNFPTRQFGDLISTPIALPALVPGGSITMTYCSNLQTEAAASYDLPKLFVNSTLVDEPPDSNWITRTVNLTPFAGQNITLKWNFDTVDGIQNDFRGWQIDNVRIEATAFVCVDVPPECLGDLDGDNDVDSTDLNILLTAFQISDAGDLDGDGDTDSLDLNILLTVFGEPCE